MIGRILSRLALIVVYYVIVTPLAILRRMAGGDPMRHKVGDMGYWQRREPATNTAREMERPS
jgi:hypothetical protein